MFAKNQDVNGHREHEHATDHPDRAATASRTVTPRRPPRQRSRTVWSTSPPVASPPVVVVAEHDPRGPRPASPGARTRSPLSSPPGTELARAASSSLPTTKMYTPSRMQRRAAQPEGEQDDVGRCRRGIRIGRAAGVTVRNMSARRGQHPQRDALEDRDVPTSPGSAEPPDATRTPLSRPPAAPTPRMITVHSASVARPPLSLSTASDFVMSIMPPTDRVDPTGQDHQAPGPPRPATAGPRGRWSTRPRTSLETC